MNSSCQRGARIAALTVLATVFIAGTAAAQTQAQVQNQTQTLWGQVFLPGGAAAGRHAMNLGDAEGHDADSWLLDFTRGHYALTESSVPGETFARYVDWLQKLMAAGQTRPKGYEIVKAWATSDERDRAKAFVELLGMEVTGKPGRLAVVLRKDDKSRERAGWLRGLGLDPEALAKRLTAGGVVAIEVPMQPLPLPLPEFWQEQLFSHDKNTPPIVQIARSRNAVLFYHGLMAVDDETLQFLSRHASLLKHLFDLDAAVFAAFARSWHVRGDVVEVPGGPDAVEAWEGLVGRRVRESEAFSAHLFDADEGRLAYLYDAVAQWDPPHQAFVLSATRKGESRYGFLRSIYDRFASFQPQWKVIREPLFRPAFDPVLALTFIEVHGASVGPSWWPDLLDEVAGNGDWSSHPDRAVKEFKDRQADAKWLLDWLFESPTKAVSRFELLRFAQRRFIDTPRSVAADVDLALHSFNDMPALGLMIERLGVQDAALFANLGRAASRLTNSGRATAMAPALRRWQAGLGLLEEVQRLRRLSPDAVGTLLASFGKTAPEDVGQPDGKVGNWLLHDLLPALGLVAGEPQTLESVAVRAFVGTAPPDLTLTWESLPYVLDWRGPVERDALAIRRAHPGLTLTDLAALDDFRRRLESPTSSIDEAHAIGKGLSAFQPRLALLPLASGKRPPIIDELRDSARRLTQLEAKDLAKARGELPHVLEAIDQVSSVVIPGLLYALAASPTEQPPATYADMWSHHLNVVDNETQPDTVKFGTSWRVTAWQVPIPVVRAGGGAGLQGAFLGVDVALADARLVAVGAPASDEPAQVEDRDRAGLVSMLALHSPPLIAARAADGVANAIASGRAMVAQWLTAHARRDVIRSGLRAAGVSEWRVNLFLWKFDHAEDVTEALTMADLYALGTDNELPVAFGGASMPIDGCVCQVVRTRRAPEVLLGYWGAGLDGASFVDLTLRLIEHLSALKLPAGLATVLLPAAIQDLLDHVHQYSPNDWDALASWARRLPQERVEQYLLALVSNGTLVPPGGGGH